MSARPMTFTGAVLSILLAGTAESAPDLHEGSRVFVIGDQLAMELAERDVFTTAVTSAGGTVHGLGFEGNEAASLRFPPALESDDVVLVCVGMIDSLRGDSHRVRFHEELASAIESATHDRIVLITPLPREVESGEHEISASNHAVVVGLFADAVRRVAVEQDCTLVDLHDPLAYAREQTSGSGLLRDGMHLDENGWSIAEAEVLWQLGWSEQEPRRFQAPVELKVEEHTGRELELLRGDDVLAELPRRDAVLPAVQSERLAPTWDEALRELQTLAVAEPVDVEALRGSMFALTTSPGRKADAMAALAPHAEEGQPDDVRLAALAALDDLRGDDDASVPDIQTVRIGVVPVKMTYDPARFEVRAGEPVRLILTNTDAQPHNLLVCMPGSLRAIGRASEAMGTTVEAKARHWVPDSPKVLHAMPMVQLGQQGELRFMAPQRPGRYPIICTYPGHWQMMNGVMTVRRNTE